MSNEIVASEVIVVREGPEEVLDFKGREFNIHFCPNAIDGKVDCNYIYCNSCYFHVKPDNKQTRTTADNKAKKSSETIQPPQVLDAIIIKKLCSIDAIIKIVNTSLLRVVKINPSLRVQGVRQANCSVENENI